MHYRIINRKKKILIAIADLIGYSVWAPINLFKKKSLPEASGIKDILVIRTAYIGDVVMTLPVLKPLKELYPGSKITFLTSFGAAPLFKNTPYVDEVLTYDAFWFYPGNEEGRIKDFFRFLKVLRAKPYDLVIEARADLRDISLLAYLSKSRFRVSYNIAGGGFLLTHTVPSAGLNHRVDYHLDIIKFLGGKLGGGANDGLNWCLKPTEEEDLKADEIVRDGIGERKQKKGGNCLLLGIHTGGRKELKCWPAERFALLTDNIIEEFGARVFFTGAPGEHGLIEEIKSMMNHDAVNLAGRTDLRTLIALIGKLDIFITNDSAPLHIASALKTPTVAIFGPSKSGETGPYGNVHRVVEKDFSCRHTCDEDSCKHSPYKECMDTIEITDVFLAVKDLLAEISFRERSRYGV